MLLSSPQLSNETTMKGNATMKLYVANTTKQVHQFAASIPEIKGTRVVEIQMGGQLPVFGDLNMPQIVAIVDQQSKYGLIKSEDIDRTKPFIGLCYSIDKPIPGTKIYAAMQHNTEVLTQKGKELRQQAAVASNQLIENNLNLMNEDRPQGAGETKLDAFEVTIVEETRRDGDQSNDVLAEGISVQKDASRPAPPSRGRRRG